MGGDFSFMGIIKYHYRQWRRFPHKGSEKGRRGSGAFLVGRWAKLKAKPNELTKASFPQAGLSDKLKTDRAERTLLIIVWIVSDGENAFQKVTGCSEKSLLMKKSIVKQADQNISNL